MNILKCMVCGNIVVVIDKSFGTISCCNTNMKQLEINCDKYHNETHLPKIKFKLGGVDLVIDNHPQTDMHFIEWVILEYKEGFEIKYFKPNDNVLLRLSTKEYDNLTSIYTYCNVHGLFRHKVEHI